MSSALIIAVFVVSNAEVISNEGKLPARPELMYKPLPASESISSAVVPVAPVSSLVIFI